MYIIMMEEIVAEDFVYELFETAMKETIFAVPCPADCRTLFLAIYSWGMLDRTSPWWYDQK